MKTLYKNFILIDGKLDSEPKKGLELVVCKDRIEYLGEKYEENADIEVDLHGQYLLPGLINLHVHSPGSGKSTFSKNNKKLVKLIYKYKLFHKIGELLCIKNLKEELYGGVTTCRCVGGIADIDSSLKNKINDGKAEGPNLFVCDYAIATNGGHMAGTVSREFSTMEQISSAISELEKRNVDCIKLMITGGVLDCKEVGHPGDLKMEEDLVKHAVRTAHAKGIKVCAHVEGPEGMDIAIKAGVDTIEHTSKFDRELLDKIKENNTTFILTFSPAVVFDSRKDDSVEKINCHVLIEHMTENGKFALEENIKLGMGNDSGCPYVKHYNFYLEPYYFIKFLGLTTKEAIYHATLGNAEILGVENDIGSIEQGKYADMILVKENPLENILALKNLSFVMRHGKVYIKKIKKDKTVEKYLENCL